ncbi:hypothetical protein K438DRAFT_1974661 [Mycena galopus ATCC 62051]|nr:hypothetical protein K438DRAFT_1974661 [Mycena galopus ATCC 62051]
MVFTYPLPSYGGLIYTTNSGVPLPNATQMTVGITGSNGLAIDYAVVTVGESTDLRGQQIIVDDTSNEIRWSGSWTARNNFTLEVPCLSLLVFETPQFTASVSPHGNTTHASGAPGDAFGFEFAGTSILISGVIPGDDSSPSAPAEWFLTMNFTLDGNPMMQNFTRDPTYITKPHFVYFNVSFLEPGNYTLVGTVIAASSGAAALIDYLTYTPSFLTAADKPQFEPVQLGAGTQSTSSPSGSGSTETGAPQETGRQARKDTGAIAGGVLGARLNYSSYPTSHISGVKPYRGYKSNRKINRCPRHPSCTPSSQWSTQTSGPALTAESNPRLSPLRGNPFNNTLAVSTAGSESQGAASPTSAETEGIERPLEQRVHDLQLQVDEMREQPVRLSPLRRNQLNDIVGKTGCEDQSAASPTSAGRAGSQRLLEQQLRDLQVQVDQMRMHLVPPAYTNREPEP